MKTVGVIFITIVVTVVLLPTLINFFDWVHAILNESHEDKCIRKERERENDDYDEGGFWQ